MRSVTMFAVGLLCLCSTNAQLWSTTTQANEWDVLSEADGSVVTRAKCTGCGRGEAQRNADFDHVAGIYYTLRLKEGLTGGHIELHGFDVASGHVATEVKLPQFAKFAGSWAH